MTTKPADLSTSNIEMTRRARRAFFVSLFDMTWRLTAGMLAPLFVGLLIDSRIQGGGKGFATVGFIAGMLLGVLIIRNIVKKLEGKNSI